MVKRREKEPASVEDLPVKEEEVERAAGGADNAEESVAGPLADADSKSVLAQVQRYQMRHQGVKGLAQQSDSDLEDDDSDTDGDEEEDYQVFGRMTIKAQSEAFYQVRLQQKENAAPAFAKNSKKTVPKFMKRNTAMLQRQRLLQTHKE